jgi:hypothetical protein
VDLHPLVHLMEQGRVVDFVSNFLRCK